MPLLTNLTRFLATRMFGLATLSAMLSVGLLATPALAQFGELLPPAGGLTPPSTGTTRPNTNPFELPTSPGTPATPPGGGLTPTPGGTPTLPDFTTPGTPATPGNTNSPTELPEGVDPARAEKAQQVAELIKNGKYAEAEAILNKELADNPRDAGAWFFLAGSQRLQDKYDDAIASYTKTIEFLPEYGDAYLRRGIVWFQKGDYGVAALDFEFASTLNYNDPRPEMWRGLSLAMLDQPRLAISAYTAAIKFDPLYVIARVNRGLAYLELQDYIAASIDFTEAIRLEPSNAGHYFKRGVAFAKRDLSERAVASYNEAIRLDPKFAEAYYNRSVTLSRLGKTAAAARDRDEALRLDPTLAQGQR